MNLKVYHIQEIVIFSLISLSSVFLISCSLARTSPTPSPDPEESVLTVEQSTAQEAVLSYYRAINEKKPEMMAILFSPNDESNQLFLQGFRDMLALETYFEADNVEIYVVEISQNLTRIRTSYHQRMFQNNKLVAEMDSGGEYTLIQENAKWYFIGMGDIVRPGWLQERP